ncbi:MoaD/ThiS family protein [Chloroflexota bacterium]
MSIKLIIPTYLQPYTDNRETADVKGSTIAECLNILIKQHPAIEKMLFNNGKIHSYIGIFINGEDAYPDILTRLTRDGDEIHVIYIIEGG